MLRNNITYRFDGNKFLTLFMSSNVLLSKENEILISIFKIFLITYYYSKPCFRNILWIHVIYNNI